MIRFIAENVLLALLPTLIYVIWVAARTGGGNDPPMSVGARLAHALHGAPFGWLLVLGATFILFTLSLFGTVSGGNPDQIYRPAEFKDGKVKPGHFE